MKKLIVFDLDGTILDTIDDIKDSMNYALRKFNYPEHSKEEYISYLGRGAKVLAERSLPDNFDRDIFNDFLATYLKHYKNNRVNKTKPFTDTVEILNKLKEKHLLGVISNKPHSDVIAIVEKFFPNTFNFIAGQSTDFPEKPAPDILLYYLDKLGVSREEAIYIGDSLTDYHFAINCGIDYFLIRNGYENQNKLINLKCINSIFDFYFLNYS